jgi:hypothetical protein
MIRLRRTMTAMLPCSRFNLTAYLNEDRVLRRSAEGDA